MPKTLTFDASIKNVKIATKIDDDGDRYAVLNVVLETDANVTGIVQRLVSMQHAGQLTVELVASQHELPLGEKGDRKGAEEARA